MDADDIVVPDEKKDQLARIDTELLYQPFLALVNATYNGAALRGWFYIGTNGNRSYEEQDKLYAQGRTTPGHIVTNAPGGSSEHNFGIALDSYPTIVAPPRLVMMTPDVKENYRVLAEEAVKAGLEAGYYWQLTGNGLRSDDPHIQLPLKRYGIKLSDLRHEYANGGRAAVFAFLDKYKW